MNTQTRPDTDAECGPQAEPHAPHNLGLVSRYHAHRDEVSYTGACECDAAVPDWLRVAGYVVAAMGVLGAAIGVGYALLWALS